MGIRLPHAGLPALMVLLAATAGCMRSSVHPVSAARPDATASQAPQGPVSAAADSQPIDLAAQLAALAATADPHVIRLAVEARRCAVQRGDAVDAQRLAVIDYTRPSTEQRLWVFDVQQRSLLYSDYVAHGRNTGGNLATRFSNREGSLESSLGLFRTAETYDGENGYSLRMDGMEPGINDQARPRAIVMHGAWYVDPLAALKQGRLGRSLGCPALRPQVARQIIDALKHGQMLFAYYPDRAWLGNSRYLTCGGDEPPMIVVAGIHAPAR